MQRISTSVGAVLLRVFFFQVFACVPPKLTSPRSPSSPAARHLRSALIPGVRFQQRLQCSSLSSSRARPLDTSPASLTDDSTPDDCQVLASADDGTPPTFIPAAAARDVQEGDAQEASSPMAKPRSDHTNSCCIHQESLQAG